MKDTPSVRRPVDAGRTSTTTFDLEHLKATIPVEDVARYFCDGEGRPQGSVAMFLCPFHDDTTPSLRVPLSGQWAGTYRCFSCGAGGTGCIDFVCDVKGIPRDSAGPAIRWLVDQFGGREESPSTINCKPAAKKRKEPEDTPVSESFDAAERQSELFRHGAQFRAKLVRERCWVDEYAGASALDHFRIELVKDAWGALRYRFPFFSDEVAVYWQDRAVRDDVRVKWTGPKGTVPVPFNFDSLDHGDWLLLVEGLPDAVTAWHLDVTKTIIGVPGAHSLTKSRWLDALEHYAEHVGHPIVVVADNDPAGIGMREKLDDRLGDLVRHVYVPEDYGDITDWWVDVGHRDEDERNRMVQALKDASEGVACLSGTPKTS